MEKLRFKFEGPVAWSWSFTDPERAEGVCTRQRFFTVSVHHQPGTERWRWYVVGFFGESIDHDDLEGKATSMQSAIDEIVALFKRAGLDVEIPFPMAN